MQNILPSADHCRRHVLHAFLPALTACLFLFAASAFAQDTISPAILSLQQPHSPQVRQPVPDQATEQQMPVLAVPEDRGLLYGLLSGTLVGSWMYNEPFSGIGVADILLLILIGSLILKFIRSRITIDPASYQQKPPVDINAYRKQRTDTASPASGEADAPKPLNATRTQIDIPEDEPNPQLYERAAGMWDHLKGNTASPSAKPDSMPRKRSEGFTDAPQAVRDDQPLTVKDAYQSGAKIVVPDSFDTDDFLKGAKIVFARLQHSWDARDMDDIAQFTTPEVHDEIQKQAKQDPTPSSSELLLVNARILEVKQEDNGLLATVFFDVLMRENKQNAQTEQVREIWHFLKSDEYAGIWRLDGIEHISG